MFHLLDNMFMSMQHSYTFSSIDVPYSVGEKSIKTGIHHEVHAWPSG